MLLTISTSYQPATDLGYLLHKRPGRCQSFELSFGKAHVFYSEVSPEKCTSGLLLSVDPIALVRNRKRLKGESQLLQQYVNDRPYVASSFLSVAISQIYGTALGGRSKDRQDLAESKIPLQAKLAVVRCRGGEHILRRLFEPLEYVVTTVHHPLDEKFPQWGESKYFTLTLEKETRLVDLLSHLYVLMPVLDDDKHYWVGKDEVEKLLRQGEGWLSDHPDCELITRRYLKHQSGLTQSAMAQLMGQDVDEEEAAQQESEDQLEKKVSLNQERLDKVRSVIAASGARRILDLGCGEGKFIGEILKEDQIEKVVGVDVSHRVLEIAKRRLDRLPERKQAKVELLHGSLFYRDRRLEGFDAAAVVEVIEHFDPPRLNAFERMLFEHTRPPTVIVTTPNSEYNVRFETLPAGQFRHGDHRFEWTREEFQTWAKSVADRFKYEVKFEPVGDNDPEVGPPTQLAHFTRIR